MKTNLKKIKDCRHELSIELDPQSVETAFQEVFTEIARKAKMPGFRPGKAPVSLIQTTFADTAKEEVAKKLVAEAYSGALEKHEVRAISYPSVRDLVLERGKKMTFVAEFESAPEVKLRKYKGLKIKKVQDAISDEDIDKVLQQFRDTRAVVKPLDAPRAAAVGDAVICDVEVVESGKMVQSKSGTTLVIAPAKEGQFSLEVLIGASVGDVREIPFEAETTYRIKIQEVRARELPVLDDAFAQSFGKKDLNDLKEEVRRDLQGYRRHEAREKMQEEAYGKLLDENKFTVPESMVVRQEAKLWQDSTGSAPPADAANDPKFKEAKEKIRERAERQVRLFYILEAIAEDAKVEVDDAEVERRIQEVAGQHQRDPQEVRERYADEIRHELRQGKSIDQVLAAAQMIEN
ncbi:MAG: trigger factor [Candidatus Omnitrophica bacterium]|jgi:trigger factor|nr:trigger factor [Candidatus Omnitrophota bacterium]